MPDAGAYLLGGSKQGVYLKDNFSSKTVQIGRFNPDNTGTENRMLPVLDAFSKTGVSFLRACADVSSDWITIDEIGYLESTCPEYQNALSELMACKHLLMVVRKQKLPFLDSLLAHQDVFVLDLDQPYGIAGCILMASGQTLWGKQAADRSRRQATDSMGTRCFRRSVCTPPGCDRAQRNRTALSLAGYPGSSASFSRPK